VVLWFQVKSMFDGITLKVHAYLRATLSRMAALHGAR
jgi:hypothetical protein